MATGEAIQACEQLIQKISGAQLVGCFCIFVIPRLNGKKKIPYANFASLINLDQMNLENNLVAMVKDR